MFTCRLCVSDLYIDNSETHRQVSVCAVYIWTVL